MEKKKYYSIGQVSNICKIPIKTLRYYDEMKVLIPNVRKETSNYRYYGRDQLTTAFMIRQLRQLGFNLKDIKEIIRRNSMDDYTRYLEQRLQDIEEEMVRLQKKHQENEDLLKRLKLGTECLTEAAKQDEDSEELYQVERIPKISLLKSRSVIKSYHNEEVNLERWIDIYEEAIRKDQKIMGPIYVTFHTEMFGQFFQKDCDIEFGIQVEPEGKKEENVYEYGGFTAVTTTYCGSYSDIFKRYIAMKRWIDENNYEVCGNVTEQFIISPIDTSNENEHVTKIIVPVKIAKQ